ncbi:MAG: 4-phosphoerythronate dehydrogenase PdxB [Neptuniibacter sp.]
MPYQNLNILADENMLMAQEIFSEFGKVSLCPGRSMTAEHLKGVDLLLVRSITQVNETLLKDSQVKFVGTATIGTDHIDQEYLEQNQIGFSNAPGCNADAVVDYVLSAIFYMAEQQGFDPAERTYGIIGVGNVGGRLQKRLESCGFKVLLNDPPRAETESGFVSLETLINEADFICAHTPLTQTGDHPSYHLLAEKQLGALQENTILLNAGRGSVIDNQALLQIGTERDDLSFVLDVWEHEPRVSKDLADRCSLISPHIAGYSLDGKVRGTFMLYQAFCDYVGIKPEKELSDFLPEAEVSEIQQTDLSTLDLINTVYDPLIDDRLLRDTLEFSEEEQKTAFDQLRKSYRLRRELASLTVVQPKLPKLLSGIGFQLAENNELP